MTVPISGPPTPDPGLAPGCKPVARALQAMVASSHPAVTAAAVEVLRSEARRSTPC